MPTPITITTISLVAAALLALGAIAVQLARRDDEPQHQGWEVAPGQLTELVGAHRADRLPVVAPAYVGHHCEDTVEIVPSGHRLSPAAYRRIAEATATQPMPQVDE